MDQESVQEALENSIKSVANEEYRRLSRGLSLAEKANKIEWALKELEKLQFGKIPDYSDEWVALLYLTWYQPSHINLAYSLIEESGSPIDDKIHIVDFGCGALAMHSGVALATSDAIEDGASFTRIRIDSIDSSRTMIRIGKKVWKRFKEELPMTSSWSSLRQACEIAKPRTNKEISSWGDQCWVSAIHAIYKRNRRVVKPLINSLVNRLEPDVWFTTTHRYSTVLLSELSTPHLKKYRLDNIPDQGISIFEGPCESITELRSNIWIDISDVPSEVMTRSGYFIRDYLNNEVRWNWPSAAIFHHTRRQ